MRKSKVISNIMQLLGLFIPIPDQAPWEEMLESFSCL